MNVKLAQPLPQTQADLTTNASPSASGESLRQPWIHSPAFDLSLIVGPALLMGLAALLAHEQFENFSSIPLWAWVALVVGIDVSHVYSTLFRTYFNAQEFKRNSTLLIMVPLGCWLAGAILYTVDGMLFWRVLAYLAVFHFMRQQYGFMAIYARKEPPAFRQFNGLDTMVLYLSMVSPLLYWHENMPRQFHWFMEGDFVALGGNTLSGIAYTLFGLSLLAYLWKEVMFACRRGFVNVPKNLLLLGTALSWNVGIRAFNNDLIFTATNIISHGIPYMALIWIYGHRTMAQTQSKTKPDFMQSRAWFSLRGLPLFLLLLWSLALLEEGLWDGFIWQEHTRFFSIFRHLPPITNEAVLAWFVPLLALPQATHYILDGFIWRVKPESSNQWSKALFQNQETR